MKIPFLFLSCYLCCQKKDNHIETSLFLRNIPVHRNQCSKKTGRQCSHRVTGDPNQSSVLFLILVLHARNFSWLLECQLPATEHNVDQSGLEYEWGPGQHVETGKCGYQEYTRNFPCEFYKSLI